MNGRFKSGDIVRLRNSDSVHSTKQHVVIKQLEPEEDDDFDQSGVRYLLRTPEHKLITAFTCELFVVAGQSVL